MLGERKSIYFRRDKDMDLISYISNLLTIHDFAEIARGLMRDGIKYRELKHNNPTQSTPTTHPNIPTNVNSDSTKPLLIPNLNLEKQQLSDEELKGRLDNF